MTATINNQIYDPLANTWWGEMNSFIYVEQVQLNIDMGLSLNHLAYARKAK